MCTYNTYFLMDEQTIIGYVKEKLNIFDKNELLEAKEIGDGNLNYVFRVWSHDSQRSVIIKQSANELRISKEMKISTDRTRIEADILKFQSELAPGLVPEVYLYDSVMCTCCMEDLSDHTIMRTALLQHKIFPDFADHISTFLVKTLLLTSDVCVEHKMKKQLVKNYINPELCEISEDLVYTEPFMDLNNRNNVFEPNKDFVQKELYEDTALHLEAAKCKFEFMNHSQALVHGDLHTGSIFVKEDSTKVIDPEFAFYGPAGYDIGNVVANLYFAHQNAMATVEDVEEREAFVTWIEQTIRETIDLFIQKYHEEYAIHATEPMSKVPGFTEWYLHEILSDTASIAGLEIIRRTVGMANVKDITTIPSPEKRLIAEQNCIKVAKLYIMNRTEFKTGEDFVRALIR